MANRTKEAVSSQVQFQCKQLGAAKGLPFQELLTAETIAAAMKRCGTQFRERVFTPMVTTWAMLSQAVSREGTCQEAVSRVLAHRLAQGKKPCSSDTSSYCQARLHLPGQVLTALTQETGQELHRQAQSEWLFKGRRVVLTDGSTATMADTSENQAKFPQHKNQKPGLGFPMMRFVVLLSLAVGTVLDCATSACSGKKTGEQSLFRRLWDALKSGDIVLGDRLFDAYRDIALLRVRGVDCVFGKKQSRRCDFRCGRKLGRDDHMVVWKKPSYDASRYESREEWESLPDTMEMREIRVKVRRRGFRTRIIIIVTTLLDANAFSADELADLFASRWNCELDLRSIKRAMGMHHLKCQTPDMVQKELWSYLLAYNLIRVKMAQAAAVHHRQPRSLSFTAAQTHIQNFAPHFCNASEPECHRLETELLKAIAQSRVGNRPGRKEPRAVKKRQQKYSYLTKPRAQARQQLPA